MLQTPQNVDRKVAGLVRLVTVLFCSFVEVLPNASCVALRVTWVFLGPYIHSALHLVLQSEDDCHVTV